MERSVESPPAITDAMLHLFVCGDVMTGRGIDQILRHPREPQLYEEFIAYIAWLREQRVHDSPTVRRMFLKSHAR